MRTTNLLLIGIIVTTFVEPVAAAGAQVCVRVYGGDGTFDPCTAGTGRYAYVTIKDAPGAQICTRIYDDTNCKSAPVEFDHVRAVDGSPVCTVNFHQPPISAFCASNPETYTWVDAAFPDKTE